MADLIIITFQGNRTPPSSEVTPASSSTAQRSRQTTNISLAGGSRSLLRRKNSLTNLFSRFLLVAFPALLETATPKRQKPREFFLTKMVKEGLTKRWPNLVVALKSAAFNNRSPLEKPAPAFKLLVRPFLWPFFWPEPFVLPWCSSAGENRGSFSFSDYEVDKSASLSLNPFFPFNSLV